MAYFTCKHVKTDGIPCQSPALRGRDLCYYHQRAQDRMAVAGFSCSPRHTVTIMQPDGTTLLDAYPTPAHNAFDFGLLDDAASIQLSLSTVLYAVSWNKIDLPRADRLLYGLRLASSNLRHLNGTRLTRKARRRQHAHAVPLQQATEPTQTELKQT